MSLRGGEGITHLHYTGTPLWKFGHGLSFSSFEVTIEAEPRPPGAGWTAESFAAATHADVIDSAPGYSVRVTNTGAVGGGFNVMGFITMSKEDQEAFGFPLQRLFGFVGVEWLRPGASRVVNLPPPTGRQLSVADADGQQWLHAAEYTVHIGGPPRTPDDDSAAVPGTVAVSKLRIDSEAPLRVSPPRMHL
jgi:beta-D-xylosidase 4|eukprot:COSAG02_NODE_1626_length_11587_cov_49.302577_8_plen_191_part_00